MKHRAPTQGFADGHMGKKAKKRISTRCYCIIIPGEDTAKYAAIELLRVAEKHSYTDAELDRVLNLEVGQSTTVMLHQIERLR